MKREEGTTFSPLGLVAAVWVTTLVLSLYGAKHIQDEVAKSEMLSQETRLVDTLTHVDQFREQIGLAKIETTLGGAREKINKTYTVLAKAPVDETPPPPPPDVAPPVDTGGLVHHAAPAKKRVLVIGASSIQFAIGVTLEKLLPKYEGVKVKRFGQLATGLSRPDFMNWPKKLESLASKFKPDLVITNFGGNDAQSIPIGKFDKVKFGTPEWDEKYAERVKEIIHISRKHGAQTVMLGMPIMRSPKFKARIQRLNRVTAQAVLEEGELFIPTYQMASAPNGTYRKSIKFGGKRGLMRMSDGVHYTSLGARFIVEQVMQIVERRFVFVGPNVERATAERHGFESKVLGRTIHYVAYRPRIVTSRAVVMFPGRSWDEWPNHPHRRLQTLAESHGVMLVVPEMSPEQHDVVKELFEDLSAQLEVAAPFGVAADAKTSTGAATLVEAMSAERISNISFVGANVLSAPEGVQIQTLADSTLSKALDEVLNFHAPRAETVEP